MWTFSFQVEVFLSWTGAHKMLTLFFSLVLLDFSHMRSTLRKLISRKTYFSFELSHRYVFHILWLNTIKWFKDTFLKKWIFWRINSRSSNFAIWPNNWLYPINVMSNSSVNSWKRWATNDAKRNNAHNWRYFLFAARIILKRSATVSLATILFTFRIICAILANFEAIPYSWSISLIAFQMSYVAFQ